MRRSKQRSILGKYWSRSSLRHSVTNALSNLNHLLLTRSLAVTVKLYNLRPKQTSVGKTARLRNVFSEIRQACARVAETSRFVTLESAHLKTYAEQLDLSVISAPVYDADHHFTGGSVTENAEAVLAFNLTLDTVNFGSGYFPHLHKRPGMSGYFTVASALKDYFDAHGPLSADELRALTPQKTASYFRSRPQRPGTRRADTAFYRSASAVGQLPFRAVWRVVRPACRTGGGVGGTAR